MVDKHLKLILLFADSKILLLLKLFVFGIYRHSSICTKPFTGIAEPQDYKPALDGKPYTTLAYGNGPGVNFTAGRPNITNINTSTLL